MIRPLDILSVLAEETESFYRAQIHLGVKFLGLDGNQND